MLVGKVEEVKHYIACQTNAISAASSPRIKRMTPVLTSVPMALTSSVLLHPALSSAVPRRTGCTMYGEVSVRDDPPPPPRCVINCPG